MVGDRAWHAVTAAGPAHLGLETTDAASAACRRIDTVLYLLDTNGTRPLTVADDGGIGHCFEAGLRPPACGRTARAPRTTATTRRSRPTGSRSA